MTPTCNYRSLPDITVDFPRKMNLELESSINNIKLNEIDTEDKFNSTLQRIKDRLLLNPVIFEEPKIINHTQTRKSFPPSYENLWGGERTIFIITVEIKFRGSLELFKYSPNSYSFGANEYPYIFQPYNNNILIEVESFSLENKNGILGDVRNKMSMTNKFIEFNNSFLSNWILSIEPTLETKLRSHKEKLEKLYN